MYITVATDKVPNVLPNYDVLIAQLYSNSLAKSPSYTEYNMHYMETITYETQRSTESTHATNVKKNNIMWLDTLAKNYLQDNDLSQQYHSFYIPKHSGGFRKITAPSDSLAEIQRIILKSLKTRVRLLEHNNAFAYVRGRSHKDALVRHQVSKARWFLKLDLKDFFPSCNKEFIMRQLSSIYPFSELDPSQYNNLIEVCMLDGGLPQGAPTSPLITNLIMIPIDYELNKKLHQVNKTKYTVTRYADDILISSKYAFKYTEILGIVKKVFDNQLVPFTINTHKTRYSSFNGRNWNLGLMYNNQGQITVGHKRKKRVKSALYNLFRDNHEERTWELNDIQVMLGEYAYLKQIEPTALQEHVTSLEQKFNISFNSLKKLLFAPN